MCADPTLNKEYLPLPGMPALTEGLTRLLLGESSLAITQNRVGFKIGACQDWVISMLFSPPPTVCNLGPVCAH